MSDKTTVADDVLRGGPAIAEFLGQDVKRTYRALERGWLPAGKEGALWVASKRRLLEYHTAVTSGSAVKR